MLSPASYRLASFDTSRFSAFELGRPFGLSETPASTEPSTCRLERHAELVGHSRHGAEPAIRGRQLSVAGTRYCHDEHCVAVHRRPRPTARITSCRLERLERDISAAAVWPPRATLLVDARRSVPHGELGLRLARTRSERRFSCRREGGDVAAGHHSVCRNAETDLGFVDNPHVPVQRARSRADRTEGVHPQSKQGASPCGRYGVKEMSIGSAAPSRSGSSTVCEPLPAPASVLFEPGIVESLGEGASLLSRQVGATLGSCLSALGEQLFNGGR